METYFDTSALICLYAPEDNTDAMARYVSDKAEPISIHGLHEMEMENAIRLKVFRGEATQAQCRAILNKIAEHISEGLLVRRSVNWTGAINSARKVSAGITARAGCRSLDILHIGLALHWECSFFVSLDDWQIRTARLAGLKIVDIIGKTS